MSQLCPICEHRVTWAHAVFAKLGERIGKRNYRRRAAKPHKHVWVTRFIFRRGLVTYCRDCGYENVKAHVVRDPEQEPSDG